MQLCRPTTRALNVWIFLALALPQSVITTGFSGVFSYFLRVDGVPVDEIANRVALLSIPPLLYFLWSPFTDFWLPRRVWLLSAAIIAGVMLFVLFQMPTFANSSATGLLVAAVSIGILVSASGGGLLADVVPPEQKSTVASIYEMGNLGGGALGSGCILLIAQYFSRSVVGVGAAALLIIPALAALRITEPKWLGSLQGLYGALREAGGEFRRTFWSWNRLPALFLICSPIGSGAAAGLLPGLAKDFHVSAGEVALANGILGGLLTAAGALSVTLLPHQYSKQSAYATAGLVNALMISLLCVLPPGPTTYLMSVALYLFTLGICNALFTILVFELLGVAGRSASSRYTVLLSFGNASVAYMTWIDGRGYHLFGPRGLPGTEALLTSITAIVFLLWLRLRQQPHSNLR